MLIESPLIGFIPTTDADRSREFYVNVLKLQFVEDDQFALVVRTKTSMIRIAKTEKFKPAAYTILGWEVTAIEAVVQQLIAAGVEFTKYPFLEHDALGIWTAPGGNKVAWFQDPDGNVLSISQH